jgi:predicted nucleic acid-binding protein
VQVLQEFYVQATRGSRAGALTHNEAVNLIRSWLRFHVQEHTEAHLLLALELRGRYSIAYWDAAIVAAAKLAGCENLLSEDMAHQQVYDWVRVVNPFIGGP